MRVRQSPRHICGLDRSYAGQDGYLVSLLEASISVESAAVEDRWTRSGTNG